MQLADLPRPIGYVLGGGGSLGAIQVGMLQALSEHDIGPDLVAARPHPIRQGPLLPALLASAAIPGIFPAVECDGRHLYDGGLVANVPIRQAIEMGARSVVVLDCNFPGEMPYIPATIAEALLYSMMVMMRAHSVAETLLVAATLPVVYLPGPAAQPLSSLDFRHTAALIETSYEAARPFLRDLEITGPGLYGSPSA